MSLFKDLLGGLCFLAWRILWTEKPGGLQFMGLQRVGHDSVTNIFTFHRLCNLMGQSWPSHVIFQSSYIRVRTSFSLRSAQRIECVGG